jgi:UDP-glucose 4-epimerase
LVATVLVTGGAGYIGSHTCVELLLAGHEVIVADNLSNSCAEALHRVVELGGRSLHFFQIDLRCRDVLFDVFAAHPVDAVVHFAGLKAVGESVTNPLSYYENNVSGTVNLLNAMAAHNVRQLVFSSSCTVYGEVKRVPVKEDQSRQPVNPYGRTKMVIEEMLEDLAASGDNWQVLLLRYFNPVGAHPSGHIGEAPAGIPNNLMPFVMQVAVGRHDRVRVFGGDYPTRDGSAVRDYIHVVDLAKGHLAALQALERVEGCRAVNLGTGRGSTVLEVIAEASRAVGRPIPYRVERRRAGDATEIYADPVLAGELLGWQAELDLAAMCRDHWNWQHRNPGGYNTDATAQRPASISTPSEVIYSVVGPRS